MTDFLNMSPEQIEKELTSGMTSGGSEPEEQEQKKRLIDEEETKRDPTEKKDPKPTDQPTPEAEETPTDSAALDMKEVGDVSAGAFKEAYDYYKKHAVGDPKTREQYLGQLRNELAEYDEGEDGTKEVTGGILKNFTDENYKIALASGESAVNTILKQLSATKFPNFEAFKAAREKAAASLHAQFQNSVAYPEISEKLQKGLEELSHKKGLEFGLSATEKEKEQLLMAESRKNLEQERKGAELQEALMNSQQMKTNTETERKLLLEQNERQAREWKARVELESQLRQQQISSDLKAGFEERAKSLRAELLETNNQTMAMMMQMQKEANESQRKLTQLLSVEMSQQQQRQQAQQQQQQKSQQQGGGLGGAGGLLSAVLNPILAPVTGAVGDLLGKLL